jgi:hypothetical protein
MGESPASSMGSPVGNELCANGGRHLEVSMGAAHRAFVPLGWAEAGAPAGVTGAFVLACSSALLGQFVLAARLVVRGEPSGRRGQDVTALLAKGGRLAHHQTRCRTRPARACRLSTSSRSATHLARHTAGSMAARKVSSFGHDSTSDSGVLRLTSLLHPDGSGPVGTRPP